MKNCTHCAHADWQKTTSGSLHPSGDGECGYPFKMPALPACMYLAAFAIRSEPINRRKELKEHCAYYRRK